MRDEFIAIKASSVAALIFSGMLIEWSFTHSDLPSGLLAGFALALVREDARSGFIDGCYHRARLVWHRVGPITADKHGSNIVPFRGPSA